MSNARISTKLPHERQDDDGEGEGEEGGVELKPKANKLKKRDVELPLADADIKLAEKLDSCLRLGNSRKPRFFMNKPNVATEHDHKQISGSKNGLLVDMGSIKPKNLSREELRERLVKKYETLVPELDPKRVEVKLVKVLSARESMEMGKQEAKRQLVDQMKLNSVGGNQQAYLNGTDSFKFKDGYEMSSNKFYSKKFDAFQKSKSGSHKSSSGNKVKEELEETTDSSGARAKDSATKQKFNPYDFFAPDEDDNLTDEPEEE